MTLAWPKVPGAVAALLPTVPGWSTVEVHSGPPVSDSDPDTYCTVGFVFGEASAGDFNQESGSVDGLKDETGSVACELVLKREAEDLPVVLAEASALLDSLDAALRADESLAGALEYGSFVTLSADFLPTQTATGAALRVPFAVSYYARTS